MSLLNYNNSVKELSKDTQFEVPCALPSGWTIYLIVNLPSTFPDSPPVITVSPAASHAWLDTNVVVGHEKLRPNGWGAHASLGKLVKEIKDEFMARVPIKNGSSGSGENGSTAGSSPQSWVCLSSPYYGPGAERWNWWPRSVSYWVICAGTFAFNYS